MDSSPSAQGDCEFNKTEMLSVYKIITFPLKTTSSTCFIFSFVLKKNSFILLSYPHLESLAYLVAVFRNSAFKAQLNIRRTDTLCNINSLITSLQATLRSMAQTNSQTSSLSHVVCSFPVISVLRPPWNDHGNSRRTHDTHTHKLLLSQLT